MGGRVTSSVVGHQVLAGVGRASSPERPQPP
ncbi:hypothetical protein Ae168Ps1_6150c [Pseudonocardia sp. Ae168_Ps1]|nr:hypothetical protein Ae150APs1_6084c [Pseudonocardia sp. Ae150A_Ps1]OLL70553.1 hypothetical protein Ae263Ps1_6303c [Pseudonocardia sp. Ae263_Ps1]OLL70685.1 hypothetical protein Ae168Ps1_6150c [Pseudonocardia sp. Ae168_Ps1]OLL89218.1 hypothetical protein Ae356Ps1_6137 [Pseudonocardia sp. Ae356_Ps1]